LERCATISSRGAPSIPNVCTSCGRTRITKS
jgi:hypothetical protein